MDLPVKTNLVVTSDSDPIAHYYQPLIGYFFRRRLEMGLEMLGDQKFQKLLEIGYGSGILLKTLRPFAQELYGIDLHDKSDLVERSLAKEGVRAHLSQDNILQMKFSDQFFDALLCFSVLEHLTETEQAFSEIVRVLKPGGIAIIGFPAVNKWMNTLFNVTGGKEAVEHQHVTDHWSNLAACEKFMQIEQVRYFPIFFPKALTMYMVCKCTRKA